MKRSVIIAVVILLAVSATAQQYEINIKLNNNDIENLRTALLSDNEGLRKSGVYFSGLYKVEELAGELIKILDSDNKENIRIAAAYSLYQMNIDESINVIRKASTENTNSRVRRICNALYSHFVSVHTLL